MPHQPGAYLAMFRVESGEAWTMSMEPRDVKMQIKDLEYMFSAERSRSFVEKPRATETRSVAKGDMKYF